ncbi:MAG: hypothetical protein JWP89_6971 [Schlesneria sp.]|nr:hypothetical protein [Schlesneria sp.]
MKSLGLLACRESAYPAKSRILISRMSPQLENLLRRTCGLILESCRHEPMIDERRNEAVSGQRLLNTWSVQSAALHLIGARRLGCRERAFQVCSVNDLGIWQNQCRKSAC